MSNDVQVTDIIDSFKDQITNMAYQLAFKDGTIKALEREIKKLEEEAEAAGRREPVHTIKE